ncbi:MAG: type II toxin-antitoxin system RelE/ParE family toxin [Chloroflexi bacterium]|nr:type II toxin-antitoxin system RelE/ParE family toxin [Chloroflexota bacterium]
MARIVWSRVARDDLKAIVSYIRTDSPAYAKSFALRLRSRVIQLEGFPDSGRLVPEDPTHTYRELIFGNYRIVYRHDGGTVTVLTIIHGARILQW